MLKLINNFRGVLNLKSRLTDSCKIYSSRVFWFSDDKKGQVDKIDKSDKADKGKAKNPKQTENKNKKEEKNSKNVDKGNLKDNKEDKQQANKKQVTKQNDDGKKNTVSLINEKYEISHNYEKSGTVSANQKQQLQNLVTKMLQEEGITSVRAEEIKKEIRNPLNNSLGRNLNEINNSLDAFKHINNFTDYFFYKRTFDSLDRLVRYKREIEDEKDPAFIQLRSCHRLTFNGNISNRVAPDTDMRQNVNSKNWLKRQPRLSEVEYSYNIEGNREFNKKFPQFVKEDKKVAQEKQKLLKYMKLNPDDQQIRLKYAPRNLPVGVTHDKIPEYDVDINGYKPSVTKKSRRKFDRPRVDTNFKNYEAWRCFDRLYTTFSEEMDFIKVILSPKYLISVRLYPILSNSEI